MAKIWAHGKAWKAVLHRLASESDKFVWQYLLIATVKDHNGIGREVYEWYGVNRDGSKTGQKRLKETEHASWRSRVQDEFRTLPMGLVVGDYTRLAGTDPAKVFERILSR